MATNWVVEENTAMILTLYDAVTISKGITLENWKENSWMSKDGENHKPEETFVFNACSKDITVHNRKQRQHHPAECDCSGRGG